MAKLGSLVVNIGANTKDLNKKLGRVQRNMKSMTSNITKLGRSMSASLTLPLAAIAGKSLKLAVDFEASMAKVKAVSGATGAEFKSLEDTAKRLGSTTVFTASEVSGLMLEYSKLGFSAAQINEVSEATLYLAQATGSDLAGAAAVAGATLGGFGLAAKETGRVTDVMAASFSSSALDIGLFKDSMKFVAPVAKIAGVSLEETTAMLGVLANAGIKGSMAGTALRRIFGELAEGSGTVTEKLANLSKAGLTLADSKDEVGRSAQSALLVLANGVPDIEKFNSALLDSGGAAKAAADIMNNTTEGALKAMGSALEGAAIVIGDKLAPMLRDLADWVAGLATKFKELEPTTQTIIIAIAALVASLGPLLLILPQLIAAMPIIAGAFAAMTGPIGLAVLAAVALGAAFLDINRQADNSAGAMKRLDKEVSKSYKAIAIQTSNVRFLVYQYGLEKTSLEDRKRILNELATIDIEHYGNLDATTTSMEDLTAATTGYITALKEKGREEAIQSVSKDLLTSIGEQQAAVIAAEERAFAYLEDHPFLSNLKGPVGTYEAMEGLGVKQLYQLDMYNARLKLIETNERKLGKGLKELAEFRDRYSASFDEELEVVIVTPDPDGDTGDKGDLGSKAPPAVAGSIDALKEKVALLTTEFNKAVIGSEAFNVASTELAVATLDLDTALEALKDKEDIIDEVFPTGSLAQLNASLSLLNEELLLLVPGSEAFIDKMEEIEAMSDIINPKVTALADVANTTSTAFSNLGSQISGALVDAVLDAQNFGDAMIAIGKQLIKTLLSEAIASAIANAASAKSLANQASGGLTIPGFIAAGVGAVTTGFSAVPKLAEGGIAYGRSLVEVGEYSGAQGNPEVIAPLNKLQDMLGGNSIQVYGRISGDDIVISNNRATRDRNRF
jgi:hypothetical protein